MRSKLPEIYGANLLMERARREQYFSTRVAFVFLAQALADAQSILGALRAHARAGRPSMNNFGT